MSAGFLSTGDSGAPGNYAMLDQVAALHWIKENIASFSGDPNSVTVLGHGHGAALVNLLLVSPVTKGNSQSHAERTELYRLKCRTLFTAVL